MLCRIPSGEEGIFCLVDLEGEQKVAEDAEEQRK
jgi:hypothetical protein